MSSPSTQPEKPAAETIVITTTELAELQQARQERDHLIGELGLLGELVRENLIVGQAGESLIRMAAATIRAGAAERFPPHISLNVNDLIVGAFSFMWTEFSMLQSNRDITPHQARFAAFSRAVQLMLPSFVDFGRNQSTDAILQIIATTFAMVEKEMNSIELDGSIASLEKQSLLSLARTQLQTLHGLRLEIERMKGGGRAIGDEGGNMPPTSKQVN